MHLKYCYHHRYLFVFFLRTICFRLISVPCSATTPTTVETITCSPPAVLTGTTHGMPVRTRVDTWWRSAQALNKGSWKVSLIRVSAQNPHAQGKKELGSLQWRHNGRDGVSNHQPHDCLLNRLFRHRSKKISKLRATGLCAGNSPVTGEFHAHMASNAENVSIWLRHHVSTIHITIDWGNIIPRYRNGTSN